MMKKYKCNLCNKSFKSLLGIFDQTNTGEFKLVAGECYDKIRIANDNFCKDNCDPRTMPYFKAVNEQDDKACRNCKYGYVGFYK